MHGGNENNPAFAAPYQDLVVWNYTTPHHGAIEEYNYAAAIPDANDSAWGPAPNGDTIGFSIRSRLCGRVACRQGGDFTYFQTFVKVPDNVVVTQFTISFSGMDDGSRVSIFNSTYPNGHVVPGSYVYLGGTGTTDLSSLVVSGEVNRVVITQVDDCCSGNNLRYAGVVLNGMPVIADPDVDGDGVDDDDDNCPLDANPGQTDSDGDGAGDVCDECPDDDSNTCNDLCTLGVTIVGTSADEDLDGGTGNDTIRGGDGSDHLHGNECDDVLMGEEGDDELDGDEGNDDLYGGPGEDELDGEEGDDELYGGPDNDELDGDDGNDELYGEGGDDELDGDDGDDELYGGSGDDNLDGDAGHDLVYGGDDNDFLHGSDGDDVIVGGDGDDRLIGDRDDDELDGGNGFDTAYYTGDDSEYTLISNMDGSVTIIDSVANRDGTDTLWNIEKIRFNSSLPRT